MTRNPYPRRSEPVRRGDTAFYDGYKVLVMSNPRYVPGGYVVDVARHPDEDGWPWTVTSFVTDAALVRKAVAR